jgi:hypothetical protein
MKIEDFAQMKDWWTRLDQAIERQVNLGLTGRIERKESQMSATWHDFVLERDPNWIGSG